MSHVYDNWGKLVAAVEKREQNMILCYCESLSSSFSSNSSDCTASSSSRRLSFDLSSSDQLIVQQPPQGSQEYNMKVFYLKSEQKNCVLMASVFGDTGPTFLTAVDWENPHHRRSIAASLVNGVYIHERDRQKNRKGPDALAPPWWEFFGFRLIHVLVDDADSSYFGALFEFTLSYHQQNYPGQRPPQYVMAFRGTINKEGNRAQDLKLDLHCALNNLHGSRCFEIGIQATSNIISEVGPGNIWLAGHSLGSSLALLIGWRMAKYSGIHLESYLFNPPFISAPLEWLKNEKMRFGLRLANSVLTAGVAAAVSGLKNQRTQDNDPFVGLSSWIPYLFVNPYDPICCEYAAYFEHREKMEAFGIGNIGRLATKHSVGSLLLGHARGTESEAVHLIPSAYLTTNCSSNYSGFNEAHGIQQWWRPDLELVYELYQYQSNKL